MNGRNEFSTNEKNRIVELLHQKITTNRNEQKKIRNELRRMGFYISDFDNTRRGFFVADFINLIEKQQVTIVHI